MTLISFNDVTSSKIWRKSCDIIMGIIREAMPLKFEMPELQGTDNRKTEFTCVSWRSYFNN